VCGLRAHSATARATQLASALRAAVALDTYSHAIPAMQEEATALIAGLVFAGK
jgi:hypothetical protein